jgi:AdoMet-dependent rRNA methyltransferase SPB1
MDGPPPPAAKASPTCTDLVQKPGEGLLVELDERRVGRPTSGAAVAAQWFAQDLFDQADLEDDDDEETLPAASAKQLKAKKAADIKTAQQSQSGNMTQLQRQVLTRTLAAAAAAAAADDDDSAAASSEGGSDGATDSASSSTDDGESGMPAAGPSTDADAQQISKSGFEEVPISRRHADSGAGSSDSSSDDGFDDLDDDGKAEVLALARKMLKGRDRQDIMDAAYHRYAFHESGLPRWFEEDEAKHMK